MDSSDLQRRIYQVTWHGRGGQGAVTAAMILAEAAFLDGYEGVTAAPFFGVERRGAPITATTKFSWRKLATVSQGGKADIAVVMDERLLEVVDVLAGLKPGGLLLVNSKRPPEDVCGVEGIVAATADATSAARQVGLEMAGTVLVNTPILGGFAAATGLVGMEAIEAAIREHFPGKAAEPNIEGARLTSQGTRTSRPWGPLQMGGGQATAGQVKYRNKDLP